MVARIRQHVRLSVQRLAETALSWWECKNGHWNADCERTCVTCGEPK